MAAAAAAAGGTGGSGPDLSTGMNDAAAREVSRGMLRAALESPGQPKVTLRHIVQTIFGPYTHSLSNGTSVSKEEILHVKASLIAPELRAMTSAAVPLLAMCAGQICDEAGKNNATGADARLVAFGRMFDRCAPFIDLFQLATALNTCLRTRHPPLPATADLTAPELRVFEPLSRILICTDNATEVLAKLAYLGSQDTAEFDRRFQSAVERVKAVTPITVPAQPPAWVLPLCIQAATVCPVMFDLTRWVIPGDRLKTAVCECAPWFIERQIVMWTDLRKSPITATEFMAAWNSGMFHGGDAKAVEPWRFWTEDTTDVQINAVRLAKSIPRAGDAKLSEVDLTKLGTAFTVGLGLTDLSDNGFDEIEQIVSVYLSKKTDKQSAPDIVFSYCFVGPR